MADAEKGPLAAINPADVEKILKMNVKAVYRETGESMYCKRC